MEFALLNLPFNYVSECESVKFLDITPSASAHGVFYMCIEKNTKYIKGSVF